MNKSMLVFLAILAFVYAIPIDQPQEEVVQTEPEASVQADQQIVPTGAPSEEKSDLDTANTFWGWGYRSSPYYGGWGGGWRRGWGGYGGYGRGYGGWSGYGGYGGYQGYGGHGYGGWNRYWR